MAIPQDTNAVFYHPLDDAVESVQSEAWRGRSAHAAGTVADAMAPLPGGLEFGSTDTSGTPTWATADSVDVAPLTESTALVVWYGGNSLLYACVFTVAAGALSYGAAIQWSASGSDWSLVALDATTAVVIHNRSGGNAKGRVLTVAGADVTLGPEQVGIDTSFGNSRSVRLDSTRFVTAWSLAGVLTVAVGTVTGTDITFGGHAQPGGSYTGGEPLLDALGADKFVLGWTYGSSAQTFMVVADITGPFSNTVSFGSIETFSAGFGAQLSALAALDSETYVVYSDGVGWCVCRVSGTDISIGPGQGSPEGNPEGYPVMRRTSANSALMLDGHGEQLTALRTDGYLIEWGARTPISGATYSNRCGLAVLSQEVAVAATGNGSNQVLVNALALQGHASYSRPAGFWDKRHSSLVHDGSDLPSTAKQVRLRRIDDDRVLAAYSDVPSSNPHGYLNAAAVGWGGEVEWGDAVATLNGHARNSRVAMLGTDLAVVCWEEAGGGEDRYGFAQVMSVSGNAVSPGGVPRAAYWQSATAWAPWGVEALGTASFAVVWRHDASGGLVTVGTVSGGTITFGAAVEFAADVTNAWTAPIDSTRVAIFYNTDSGPAWGLVATLSGDEMTLGSAVPLGTAKLSAACPVHLGGDSIGLVYVEEPGAWMPTLVRAVTAYGPAMSLGSPVEACASTYSFLFDATAVDGGLAVGYRDADQGNQFYGRLCRVAGDACQLGPASDISGFVSGDFGNGEDWICGLDGERIVGTEESSYDLLSFAFRAAWGAYPTTVATPPAGVGQEFGTPYTNINDLVAVAALDATRVAVAYGDAGDGYKGKMMIGELAGQEIAWGTPVEFEASSLFTEERAAILSMDATTVVVAWQSGAAVMGRVATVAGTGAVFPASAVALVSADVGDSWGVAATTSSEFVIAYRNSSGGMSRIKTVAGYDITGAAETPFAAGDASWISIAGLDSTRVILAYQDVADSGHGTVRVGSTSGGNMSWGPEAEFLSATSAAQISVAALSDSKFIVAFQDQSDSDRGKAVVGGVATGTAISGLGAAVEFLADTAQRVRVAALDGAHAIVAYADGTVLGKARAGTVSANDVAFAPEFDFFTTPSQMGNLGLAAADASTAVVAYRNGADSNKGRAKVLLPFAGGVGPFPKLAFSSWYRGGGPLPPPPTTTIPPTTVPPTTTLPPGHMEFGATTQFTPGAFEHIGVSACRFDSDRHIVCYRKAGEQGATARVATVAGSDVTFGPEATYGAGIGGGAAPGGDTSVCAIDSTRVVAAMANSGGTTYCAVGTVTGTDITFGTHVDSGNCTDAVNAVYGFCAISVVHMDLGKFIVYHAGSLTARACRVGTVSGTTISFEAPVDCGVNSLGNLEIISLSSTRCVCVGHNNNSQIQARVGVLSGSTLSFPAAVESNVSDSWTVGVTDHAGIRCGSPMAAAPVSATEFLVCWCDNDPANVPLKARVCTADAGTHVISLGAVTTPFGSGISNCAAASVAIAMLDSSTVALCVQMGGACAVTYGSGLAKIGEIVAGPNVSWVSGTGVGDSYEFVSSASGYGAMLAAAEVNAAKFVPYWIHYASPGDDLGSAAVGTVS